MKLLIIFPQLTIFSLKVLVFLLFTSQAIADCPLLNLSQLETMEDYVKSNFQKIKIAENKIKIGEDSLELARAGFDPKLSLQSGSYADSYYSGAYNSSSITKQNRFLGSSFAFGYRDGSGTFPIYEDRLQTASGGEFFTSFTIPLLRNLSIDQQRYAESNSELELQINNLELFNIRNQILSEYYMFFSTALMSKLNIDYLTEITKAISAQLDITKEKISLGALPANDLLESERFLLKNKSYLAEQENALQKAINYLNQVFLIGEHQIQACQIPKLVFDRSFPLGSVSKFYQQAVSSRPDLQVLEQRLQQQDLSLQYRENQVLPQLDLKFEYEDGLGGGSQDDTDRSMKGLLNFEYPIFNRLPSSQLRIQKRERENLILTTELFKNELNSAIFGQIQDIKNESTQLDLAAREVFLMQSLLEADQASYFEGNQDLFQINLRRSLLIQEQLTQNEHLIKYILKNLQLKIFINDLKDLSGMYQFQ